MKKVKLIIAVILFVIALNFKASLLQSSVDNTKVETEQIIPHP
ncbi:MAG: hypothetical protein AAF502_23605 [Bacteroidota bacterium]